MVGHIAVKTLHIKIIHYFLLRRARPTLLRHIMTPYWLKHLKNTL